jgi:S1-C subfamily serine protease
VHGADTIITTARAIGREDGLRVRLGDADPVDADLAGWDPATGIAVLRTRSAMSVPAPSIAESEPRTGQIVLALARSWSNALTASAGIVAVVGGPLRTGRRRQIARVIRVTAPMHDGFAGGALYDASGRLAGIATAAVIRGFGVVIPASIAWAAAAQVLTSGAPRRGFVGLAVQPVTLPVSQQPDGRTRALLIMGITPGSPADAAGLIVGDVLVDFDGAPTESADHLLDLLTGPRVGQTVTARTLRGGVARDVSIAVAERPRE